MNIEARYRLYMFIRKMRRLLYYYFRISKMAEA